MSRLAYCPDCLLDISIAAINWLRAGEHLLYMNLLRIVHRRRNLETSIFFCIGIAFQTPGPPDDCREPVREWTARGRFGWAIMGSDLSTTTALGKIMSVRSAPIHESRAFLDIQCPITMEERRRDHPPSVQGIRVDSFTNVSRVWGADEGCWSPARPRLTSDCVDSLGRVHNEGGNSFEAFGAQTVLAPCRHSFWVTRHLRSIPAMEIFALSNRLLHRAG